MRVILDIDIPETHIKLLRHASITRGSGEWGGWGLDDKRPFGNSDVVDDMAIILGVPIVETDDGEAWPGGTTAGMNEIYEELGETIRRIFHELPLP